MATRPVYGLVLAGGKSRRMGHDKALIKHDGQSQLARAVGLLEKHVKEVFVSARAEQADDAERQRYAQIIDRYSDIGPLAGILSAMDKQPQADWLVLACDMPAVDDATIEKLLANRDCANPVVAYSSSYDGLPEPLCALYKPGVRSIIDEFVGRDVYCPRKILISAGALLLEQPHAGALDNLNSPADLEEFNKRDAS